MKKKFSKVMPFMLAFVMLFAMAVPVAATERIDEGQASIEIQVSNPILDRIGHSVADVNVAQVERMANAMMEQGVAAINNADATAAHQAEIDRLLAVIDELRIDNLDDLAPFLTAMAFGADCEILSALSCVDYHLVIPVWVDMWFYLGDGQWIVLTVPGFQCVRCGAVFI